MSVFEGIEHVAAEGTSNRQYFETGHYVVEINRAFLHKKILDGGKLFIVETSVKTSDNPSIKPGEQRNWLVSLQLPNGLSRIKAFMAAAHGFDIHNDCSKINKIITPTLCDNFVTDNTFVTGRTLKLICENKKTRSGKDFLIHSWSPLKETNPYE